MLKGLLYFLIVVVLVGCGGESNPTDVPEKFQPKLNLSPKYFLTIQGHVALSLIKSLKPEFLVTYVASKDSCSVVTNSFEGVKVPYMKRSWIYANLDASGNYQLKIPLDKYMPGYCKWNIAGIRYRLLTYTSVLDMFQLAFFEYKKTIQTKTNKAALINMECNKKDCRIANLQGFASSTANISPRKSHDVVLNVEQRKGS